MTLKDEVPVEIIFFSNGQTAVGNRNGQQIGKYQDRHDESIRLLAEDGYDWKKLRVTGFPDSMLQPEMPKYGYSFPEVKCP